MQPMGRGRGTRSSVAALGVLAILVVLGLAAKGWRGPLAGWANDYLAGVVYVVFWVVLAKAAWPRARTARVAAIVLLATCAIETLQLLRAPLLETIRATWLGRALIGTTFSWLDFPHYVVGSVIGAGVANRVVTRPAAG